MRFPRSRRLPAAALSVSLAILELGCTAETKVLGPWGPPEIPSTGFARAAFLADVNLRSGRITITSPQISTTVDAAGGASGGPAFSLVGGDAVLMTTSNFSASAVGAFQPGKIRVTFDVALTNRLTNVQLAGPTTFPNPPAGTTGPLLFPYDIAVATTSGGTSGSGGDVIVVLPSGGLVAPSTDWDGAPFNFFNDSTCAGGDCYRWEEFTAVPPGATTAARTVGFDIDPTVGQFTARLIVASDLLDTSVPQSGTVQGIVTAASLGPIAGAVVTATPGGATAVTLPNGTFQISGLSPGTVSLDVTSLPTICATPPPALAIVSPGTVTSVTLGVTCTPPPLVGTVAGQVTLPGGPGLGGVGVTITPTGGAPLPLVLTDASGNFTVPNVPVSDGTGTLVLAGLPASCTNPGAVPYSGLANGGTTTVSVNVSCTTSGAGYPMTAAFGASGSGVVLTLGIDMSPYNDLVVNGVAPDDIQTIQGQVTYDSARLQLVGCASVANSQMSNLTVNTSVAGVIQFLNFTTSTGPVLGAQSVLSCSFNDGGGAPLVTTTTLTVAQSFDGHDLLPKIVIAEGALP